MLGNRVTVIGADVRNLCWKSLRRPAAAAAAAAAAAVSSVSQWPPYQQQTMTFNPTITLPTTTVSTTNAHFC